MEKLVRDNIPQIIKDSGKIPKVHIASDPEYWQHLKQKLNEEVDEFHNGSDEEIEEELADILEVIYAIADYKEIPRNDLETKRKEKEQERGAFKERIVLEVE